MISDQFVSNVLALIHLIARIRTSPSVFFHIRTVLLHLDITKVLFVHQLMHQWVVLKTILKFTLKLTLKQLRHVSVQLHHHQGAHYSFLLKLQLHLCISWWTNENFERLILCPLTHSLKVFVSSLILLPLWMLFCCSLSYFLTLKYVPATLFFRMLPLLLFLVPHTGWFRRKGQLFWEVIVEVMVRKYFIRSCVWLWMLT
jgi:hypothetical protein